LKSFSIGEVISADKQNNPQLRKAKLCPLRQHLSMMIIGTINIFEELDSIVI